MLTKREKNNYIRIATQLGYTSETINRLHEAKTELEADRIMKTARERG